MKKSLILIDKGGGFPIEKKAIKALFTISPLGIKGSLITSLEVFPAFSWHDKARKLHASESFLVNPQKASVTTYPHTYSQERVRNLLSRCLLARQSEGCIGFSL